MKPILRNTLIGLLAISSLGSYSSPAYKTEYRDELCRKLIISRYQHQQYQEISQNSTYLPGLNSIYIKDYPIEGWGIFGIENLFNNQIQVTITPPKGQEEEYKKEYGKIWSKNNQKKKHNTKGIIKTQNKGATFENSPSIGWETVVNDENNDGILDSIYFIAPSNIINSVEKVFHEKKEEFRLNIQIKAIQF